MHCFPFVLKYGIDDELYAVFKSNIELEDYQHSCPSMFEGCRIACYGQYENAYLLT